MANSKPGKRLMGWCPGHHNWDQYCLLITWKTGWTVKWQNLMSIKTYLSRVKSRFFRYFKRILIKWWDHVQNYAGSKKCKQALKSYCSTILFPWHQRIGRETWDRATERFVGAWGKIRNWGPTPRAKTQRGVLMWGWAGEWKSKLVQHSSHRGIFCPTEGAPLPAPGIVTWQMGLLHHSLIFGLAASSSWCRGSWAKPE